MTKMNSPRRQVAYDICVQLMNQEPAKQFVDLVDAALIAISEEAEKRAEAAEMHVKELEAVLERIANESMDYQYIARAALEVKP